MAKIRLYRIHLAKTVNWHQQELTKKFGSAALSEAHRAAIKQELDKQQNIMRQKEKGTTWQIPLGIKFSSNGTYNVFVLDESNLLYLDN